MKTKIKEYRIANARLIAAAGAAMLGLAASAQASTLRFSYADSGLSFSFDQSTAPTPISTTSFDTEVPIMNWTASFGGLFISILSFPLDEA